MNVDVAQVIREARALREEELITEAELTEIKAKAIKGSVDRLPIYQEAFKWLRFSAILTVIVAVLVYAREPLTGWIEQTSELKFGDFSLKLFQEAKQRGFPELGRKLQGLSEGAIIEFLETGFNRRSLIVQGSDRERYVVNEISDILELVDKGLVEIGVPYEEIQEIIEEEYIDRRMVYLSGDERGSESLTPDKKYNIALERYVFDITKLSESDKSKVEEFDAWLTKEGLDAYRILIQTVAKSI